MEENKTLKKILIVAFALMVVGGSTVAFAFWDRLTVNSLESNIITIGQGVTLVVADVEINPLTDGNLIPASAVKKANDTYEIELSYTVSLDVAVVEALDLDVTVSNIEVNGVANPFDLISVVVTNPGTIQNDDVIVTLSVTIDDSELLEADYADAYLALANNPITFTVSFAATEA